MVINKVNLNEWKTLKEIQLELQIMGIKKSSREIRREFEAHNDDFRSGLVDTYICHSCRYPSGYKMSRNHDEIMNSIEDNRKRGVEQLRDYSDTVRALKRLSK